MACRLHINWRESYSSLRIPRVPHGSRGTTMLGLPRASFSSLSPILANDAGCCKMRAQQWASHTRPMQLRPSSA